MQAKIYAKKVIFKSVNNGYGHTHTDPPPPPQKKPVYASTPYVFCGIDIIEAMPISVTTFV